MNAAERIEAFDMLCDTCHELAVAWCIERPELQLTMGQRLDPLLAVGLTLSEAAEDVVNALREYRLPPKALDAVFEHYRLDSELHPLVG
jgi:hypothetical protein